MVQFFRCASALVLFSIAGASGSTATGAPPSLAPDLAADTEPLGDERKFFVFHQQGISQDQALKDFRYCFRYTKLGGGVVFPYFLPLEGSKGASEPVSYDGGQFGLVGAAIGAIIAGPIERSKRQISLMRCMLPRGYTRYRISEAMWKRLNGADDAAAIAMQAEIATGPVPKTPRVQP